MANVGDRVLYNEGIEGLDAFAVGWVVMTDTDPGATTFDAYQNQWGSYPNPPAAGQALIYYIAMVGSTAPLSTYTLATEGTAPGQYQLLA
jgi:hypothetical protein